MFSMSFSTDGADFYDNDELIVDILNDVGNCVNDGVGNGNIFDPHGTIIGSWELDQLNLKMLFQVVPTSLLAAEVGTTFLLQ